MKTIRYHIFFLMQIVCFSAISQKQQIRFDHLSTDQGLSQSNVLCILQDSRGFMWFGTRDGLNKYDSYKFTVYKNNIKDGHSISNNNISSLVESTNGDLWIATWGGGLNRFDRAKNEFISYKHDEKDRNSIASDFLSSVCEDSEGNLWIGTKNSGLDFFDKPKNRFVHYTNKTTDTKSISSDFIRTIYEDPQHNLWIGTVNGGLNLFNRNDKTFSCFLHNGKNENSLSHNDVLSIFEDSKNRLWIGTNGGGLNLFDKSTGKFLHYNSNGLRANFIYAINEDKDHKIWIGTENDGLNIFDPSSGVFNNYLHDEIDNTSLSSNSIVSICKSNDGNMWMGTFSGGLDLVNMSNQFSHFKHSSHSGSLSNNNVLCIYEDSKQNIWIGTDGGGLNLFNPSSGSFTHFLHDPKNKNSISGNYILNVYEDDRHNIWIGTWGDGVTIYNPEQKTFQRFKNDPSNASSLSSNNAWTIYEDKDKNIWIGTHGGGLNLYDRKTNSFKRYNHVEEDKQGLNSNRIYSILDDAQGHLWIGTDGGGVNIFDKQTQKFTHYLQDANKNSLVNNSVGYIYKDSHSNFWFSTKAGLSYLDAKTKQFTNYTTEDGLPNDIIFGILEDKQGKLWISTGKGISCFDPSKKSFENYDVVDGLQADEFKENAFCKTRSGAFYFGGNNGFNTFFPENIKEKSFDPPIVITNLKLFDKEIPIAKNDSDESPLKKEISESNSIIIPYSSSVIEFEFAALSYTNEKKQYSYMLEGFDKKWNKANYKRTATYTNLDPGNYLFIVKSMNNDGQWSSHILTFQLTVTPPFWLTWWFKSICVLFILGCFVGFFRFRMKAVTKQKAQLEEQVEERTEEIMLQKENLSRNVDELATLKEDLQKEKYYLDSLMDNMPDAIYFKDKESRFIRVSKYMLKKHMANQPGATMNDLLGKSDFDLQDKKHAKEAYDDEQEIQKTGIAKIDYIEKEIAEDGSERWVASTKLPMMNMRGDVVGTFGISRDITKIKILEKQQHEAQLRQAIAQNKFEIASEVIHDIGNAVVGFGSYLNRVKRLQENSCGKNLTNLAAFFEEQKILIASAIGESKADAVVNMLSGIEQTQNKTEQDIIKSITEQLSIIANIEEILNIQRSYVSGYESKERKTADLRSIINDALPMLSAVIEETAVNVSLEISDNLPPIKGDRTKLMQLILNIIKNSIEATRGNTSEKHIYISALTTAGKLILQVKDNGKGFDSTTADRLFNRGFSTKEMGIGNGLYNCKTIIESHEGTIDIISEGPGKGALATIAFKILAA